MTLKALLLSLSFSGLMAQEETQKHIFFDFHSVLVIKKPFLSWQNKWNVVKAGAGLIVSLRFWKTLYSLYHNKPVGKNKITESYFNVIKNFGYTELHQQLIRFANDIFIVNQNMIPVLEALKEQGHKLHLFSNVGARVFNDAKERKLFDSVLDFFDKNVINQEIEDIYTIWKPQPQSFDAALATAGAQKENAIMIDDKAKNIPAHWSAGIIYNKHDHAGFIDELIKLELLPNTFTIEEPLHE